MQNYSKQREAVVEYLAGVKTHPTAEEIFLAVRRRIPNISLATVYRNVAELAAAGAILKIEGAGRARYDGDIKPHYHAVCLGCGCVADAEMPHSSDEAAAAEATGFKITGHTTLFCGYCEKCRTKE